MPNRTAFPGGGGSDALSKCNGLIMTGATGTNVNDVAVCCQGKGFEHCGEIMCRKA